MCEQYLNGKSYKHTILERESILILSRELQKCSDACLEKERKKEKEVTSRLNSFLSHFYSNFLRWREEKLPRKKDGKEELGERNASNI